jgi:hypothetical protein
MRNTSDDAEQTAIELKSRDECCRDARPNVRFTHKTARLLAIAGEVHSYDMTRAGSA